MGITLLKLGIMSSPYIHRTASLVFRQSYRLPVGITLKLYQDFRKDLNTKDTTYTKEKNQKLWLESLVIVVFKLSSIPILLLDSRKCRRPQIPWVPFPDLHLRFPQLHSRGSRDVPTPEQPLRFPLLL